MSTSVVFDMPFSWDEIVAKALAKNPGDISEVGCIDSSEALIDFVERCGQHIVEASKADLSLTLTSGCILNSFETKVTPPSNRKYDAYGAELVASAERVSWKRLSG
jgi:hypothetical protein